MKRQDTAPNVKGASSLFSSHLLLSLLLIIATVVVYLPIKTCEFTNYDDQDYVTANSHVKDGLSWAGIKWAFTTGAASNWHPLTWISHMLDVQFFGLNPLGHHLTNIALHAAATIFLFLALARLTRAPVMSAFVAAFFSLHPMHVESVAWIAERKDVLCAFFGMLTLWLYAIYTERRKTKDAEWKGPYVLMLISFALGLLAKPMLVTLPFVLLLLDFWPQCRIQEAGWKPVLLEKVPLFFLSLASSIVTFLVQHSAGAVRDLTVIPIDSRILNSLIAYWRYIGKLFWPVDLAVFYPMSDWVSGWGGVAAGIGLIAVSIILILKRKKYPELLVGWLWFLGTLVPVIGIVQVGAQSMADRYSYIPSIGFFIFVVWGASKFFAAKFPKPLLVSCGCLLLLVCVILTVRQIPYWKNTATLFQHALTIDEKNFVAHINLASSLMNKDDETALAHFNRALELRDDMFEAHYGSAVIFERRGKIEEAAERYRTAVQLRPNAVFARNNLGSLLLRLGKTDEAIGEFKTAIDTDPTYAEAHYNLGLALADRDKQQSIVQYEEAVRLRPDYSDALNNLAVALASAGKFDSAATRMSEVVRLNPKDAEAHFNLSFVLSKLGRTNEAKEHYDAAFKLNPGLVQKK